MKKILYTIALAAAVFTGCKKEVKTDGVGTLQMNLDRSTAGYVTKATNDNPKEFVIEIKRTSDGWTRTYPRFANMPQQLDLPSGHYSVTATSLYQELAAWDQPIYSGTKEFDIVTGELTAVSLVCTLSNMKVTIVPSGNFMEEVAAYTVTVTNAYGCTNTASANVMVFDNNPQMIYDTVCQGSTYNNNGFTLSSQETAEVGEIVLTHTVFYANCESEIVLFLTVMPNDTVYLEQTATVSFVWNGVTYTEEGTYTQHFNI